MSHSRPGHAPHMRYRIAATLAVLSGGGVFLFGFLVGRLTDPVSGMLGGVGSLWWFVLLTLVTAGIAASVTLGWALPQRLKGFREPGLQKTASLRQFSQADAIAHDVKNEPPDDMSQLTEAPGVPDTHTSGIIDANRENGLVAFLAAVRDAQQEAERQLTAAVQRARDEDAELRTAELARVREELERQHAHELQRARRTAREAFEALTSRFAPEEAVDAQHGRARATKRDENAA